LNGFDLRIYTGCRMTMKGIVSYREKGKGATGSPRKESLKDLEQRMQNRMSGYQRDR
jgi:hypothetical protein